MNPFADAMRVVRSDGEGQPGTWQAAVNGLPDVPVQRLHADYRDPSGRSLFAATSLGVYYTSDAGDHWTLFRGGLPQVRVTDLYMPPDGRFLRIATYGRGVLGNRAAVMARGFFTCVVSAFRRTRREVRLKPDATYYNELETAIMAAAFAPKALRRASPKLADRASGGGMADG